VLPEILYLAHDKAIAMHTGDQLEQLSAAEETCSYEIATRLNDGPVEKYDRIPCTVDERVVLEEGNGT